MKIAYPDENQEGTIVSPLPNLLSITDYCR